MKSWSCSIKQHQHDTMIATCYLMKWIETCWKLCKSMWNNCFICLTISVWSFSLLPASWLIDASIKYSAIKQLASFMFTGKRWKCTYCKKTVNFYVKRHAVYPIKGTTNSIHDDLRTCTRTSVCWNPGHFAKPVINPLW